MAFSLHFEKWLNDTLLEVKRIADRDLKIEAKFDNNKQQDALTLNMSDKYGGSSDVAVENKVTNGEHRKYPGSGGKSAAPGNDYYKFVWNEDDGPMDDVDDEEEDEVYRKRTTRERVAKILGKPESELDRSGASDSFYDLPDNITGQLDSNYNFEPDFSLRYSASLDFSDIDDRTSVTSEAKSYADDPEQFMRDFHMENDFIEIARVDPEGQNIGDKRLSSNEDVSMSSPDGVSPQKGVFSSIRSPKAKNAAGDGFTIRYVKTVDVVEDAYMDDDLRPVGMTAEECQEVKSMYGTGMLPMTAVDMTLESEDDVMLDYGTAMAVGRSRSQKMSGDREPIVNIEEANGGWAAKHRRAVIGIAVFATILMIVAFSVVVYFIVQATRGL